MIEAPALDLGGLDLSTLGALRRGGATSGARIVVAGDPDASVIVQKLRGTYPYGARMPRLGVTWGDDEMALLVVHGVLHLLGMDHVDDDEARTMQQRERDLLGRFHSP